MNQYAAAQRSHSNSRDVVCDLRSDTVTLPDPAMLQAMASADLGDDVYGEDPSVNRLETVVAERTGKERALFVPSGTMSNLLAVLSHCGRGEEVLLGKAYHVNAYEAAGASVLGGVALCPLPIAADGALEAADIEAAIKPDDSHMPVTRLLSLENTHYGKAISLDRLRTATEVARRHGLAVHLDGARFFNAVTELKCEPTELAALFDTVSICLSKGLGTPAGSVLTGCEAVIARARRLRKMLGGGMRQAGLLAAAGLYALDNNVARLSEDHHKAEELADRLIRLDMGRVEHATNMVFFTPSEPIHSSLRSALASDGIIIGGGASGAIRLVLHKDVDAGSLSSVEASLARFKAA